jgi:hypothetical protein
MSATFFKLLIWTCMYLPECGPTWHATYSDIGACQRAAVVLELRGDVMATACISYRVRINK